MLHCGSLERFCWSKRSIAWVIVARRALENSFEWGFCAALSRIGFVAVFVRFSVLIFSNTWSFRFAFGAAF